jgi:peptidoglycan/xylan/chitin deacetylase (PgdA/CDA1 family)
LIFAYPILKRFEAKATIFVPTAFVGKNNAWDEGKEAIMSWETLKGLDATIFSLAYHSHQHLSYKNLNINSIEADLAEMMSRTQKEQIVVEPYFAYPYGAYPKDRKLYRDMIEIFKRMGIKAAFRIGNRCNSFIINDLHVLERIDIRGDESLKITFDKITFCKKW